MTSARQLWLGLIVSLVIALWLQLVTLPDNLAAARPLWVALMIAYWALCEPRVSVLLPAFIVGLLFDTLFATPLGQHALGLVLVAYVVERVRSIFILFPLWQATLALLPVWLLYSFLMFWIDGRMQHQAEPWLRWLPVLSTTLFWPLLYSTMALLRQPPEDE